MTKNTFINIQNWKKKLFLKIYNYVSFMIISFKNR